MTMPGIIIGQTEDGELLELATGEHVALHARTGAGKGVGFTIPNCFAWPGSLVVLDVKGQAFRATAGARQAMGQDVYLFDPASRTRHSHRWNPYAAVGRDSDERFQQISRLANLFFPIEGSTANANKNEFWDDVGRQAFTAVSTILAETPQHPLTLTSMFEMFTRSNAHEWLGEQLKARPYSQIAVDGLSDYIGDDPRMRNDIRKTVSAKLQIWSDPKLRAATEFSDFDLSELRRRPMTIYVAVAPGNLARLKPLLRLFWDAVINLNTDLMPEEDPTLKVPLLMLMDEFARLGRVDTLAQAPQYVRDYWIRMAFVVQSKAQVRAIYGNDAAKDIFDNLGAEVVFGTTDPDLTKELEERLGDNTISVTTANRPRFWPTMNWQKQSEAMHPHRRQLMLDQEIAQMPAHLQLIIRAGMRPMITHRVRWFDDPRFSGLVLPPPVVPKLRVSVPMHYPKGRPQAVA